MKVVLPKCMYFLILFTFFAFNHDKILKKTFKISSYQKFVYLGVNTFILCSQITVFHVCVNVYLKLTHLVTVTRTELNQEVTKLNDKHAAEYSNTVCWDVKYYV